VQSRGYPGSPFILTPFVFKNAYKPMARASPKISASVSFSNPFHPLPVGCLQKLSNTHVLETHKTFEGLECSGFRRHISVRLLTSAPRCMLQDADTGLTMVAYHMEIKEFFADAGFTGTPCAGAVIPSMGYAVAGQAPTAPGPLIFSSM
jgi:hypothetical protein